MKKKKISLEKRKSLSDLAFISPWILGTLVLFIYPVFSTVKLSVSELVDINGLKMTFIGLEQYQQIFIEKSEPVIKYLTMIQNILIKTPFIVCFSLIFGMLLVRDFKGRSLFRMFFLFPFILGTGTVMEQLTGLAVSDQVSSATTLTFYLSDEIKLLLGPEVSNFLMSYIAILSDILWKSSVQIVIFIGALQTVPSSLYESADCDGATGWEKFWNITYPFMSRYITLNVIYTITFIALDEQNPVLSEIIDQSSRSGQGLIAYTDTAVYGTVMIAAVFLCCVFAILLSKIWEKDVV